MKHIFILIALCCSAAAFTEERDLSQLNQAIRNMSDDSFDVRQAAEFSVLEWISAGRQAEVKAALQAAIDSPKVEAELKARASKLLQICDDNVVNGLGARLIAGPIGADGMLHAAEPFTELPEIKFRITNAGNKPFQIARSSYPLHRFFKLEIVKLEDGGKKRVPIKAYFDLYPFKDMRAPDKVYETLQPAGHFERDMKILLREGYLVFALKGNNHVVKSEFGLLRTPGIYEICGTYSIEPAADGHVFEKELGRDKSVPLWNGASVKSKPILLQIGK